MDNSTLHENLDREATTEVSATTSKRLLAQSNELNLSRIWLGINLAGIGAVGAVYPQLGSPQLFAVWAAFTLLNSVLYLASRKGLWVGNAAAGSHSFNVGIAAIFGLSWSIGAVLMLPALDATALATVLATVFAVSVMAIPVFSNSAVAATYFIATVTVIVSAGLIHDGRFALSAIWVVLLGASLKLVDDSFSYRQAYLRRIVDYLLDNDGSNDVREAQPDYELGEAAERQIHRLRHLEASAQRNHRVMRALGDAVIATNATGQIESINPVAEVLLGFTEKDLRGKPLEHGLRLVFPPDRRNQAQEIFNQTRLTRRSQHGDENVQLIRRDGVVYGVDYVVTSMKDDYGEFAGAAFVIRDVTERRHKSEDIAWKASHDTLTGTINRSEFEIRLKKLLERTQEANSNSHALLYLDIDKFKFINDTYGHAAGDSALKALSQVLRSRIRGADTLARVGGDEFAALLYSCSGDKARLIAESLRIAVERHDFKFEAIELPLSLSIGIVEINDDCKSVAEIIRAADSACYSAKKFGRNRVHQFEKGATEISKQARVFDFVKDIQTAIHGGRLELFYHPMYAGGETHASDHCELSVGIRNTDGDIIPRRELAELSRRYHLTDDIDRWVVKAAIDALRLNHPALSEMKLVMVPLSQRSLGDDRLLSYIKRQVKENQAQAHRLGFAFDDADGGAQLEHVRYFMTALKDYGCKFMISDVAFGGETLEFAKSLNADFFGIRSSLVENMLYNSVDYEIVLGLSRVAHALGMRTIAEQADTQLLRDALAKMGIDFTKGHNLGEPRKVTIQTDAQWV